MSKVRNPHLVPTGAVATGFVAGSVNVENVISVEYGYETNELLFNFNERAIQKDVVWKMSNNTVRNAEFALIAVPSDDWDAGTTQLPFVTSSLQRIVEQTGADVTQESAVNLDLIDSISKFEAPVKIGGGTVYSIVFAYKAWDHAPKQVKWSYASESDRDDVFDELTNPVAAMTHL